MFFPWHTAPWASLLLAGREKTPGGFFTCSCVGAEKNRVLFLLIGIGGILRVLEPCFPCFPYKNCFLLFFFPSSNTHVCLKK